MKQKDITALHTMSEAELAKKLSVAQASLAMLVKDRYTKQSKNVREGKALRIEIARLSTILREKELLA
jgi:ribosomal protein L29